MAIGSTLIITAMPQKAFSMKEENRDSYQPGDQIALDAYILDTELGHHKLIDLCQSSKASVVMLYIYGGRAMNHSDRLGGIWCPDSFEDFHTLRFIHKKYDDSQVKIIPVACAPVYSSLYYGLQHRVFLDKPDDDKIFKESVKKFIESTEKAVKAGYVPLATYYDLRHRLLFNDKKDLQPGEAYGQIFSWQGKFRAEGETQKYGTPTIWLLNADGVVLSEPFHGNTYHSDPYQIGYTVLEVDRVIRTLLEAR